MTMTEKLTTLSDYSEGKLGTRETIDLLGFDGYADLLIALAKNDLQLPKPADTPERRAMIDLARAVLQPRLRRHAG